MKIYIITEDLGDGDVGLRYFKTESDAQKYYEAKENNPNYEYNPCWHESNPHVIDLDKIINNEFEYDL